MAINDKTDEYFSFLGKQSRDVPEYCRDHCDFYGYKCKGGKKNCNKHEGVNDDTKANG